jgi:hypothetical protein
VTVRESTIEAHLVQRVKAAGGIAYKWVSSSHAGVPDRIVILPNAYMAFVELKAPGKKPTALQNREHAKLIRMGMRVYVIDSIDGVDEFMEGVLS